MTDSTKPVKPKSWWSRLWGPSLSDQVLDGMEAYRIAEERDMKERLAKFHAKQRANRIREIAQQLLIERTKVLDPRSERLSPRDGDEALEQAARIYELSLMHSKPELPDE
ncbi:MAG: hypothetical protein RR740_00700 [Pseudomonas sp.]